MKKRIQVLNTTSVILWSLFAIAQSSHPAKLFKGEIADTSCAYNVHSLDRSHKEMLKAKGAGNSAASCTRYCVQHMGADYVLVQKDNIYRLADQANSMFEPFAGAVVTLHGTLDARTNTIHVSAVAP
jgi:hypothetical protein